VPKDDKAGGLKPRCEPPCKRWAQAGIEPSIEELLNDPIATLLRRRDRLSLEEVRHAVALGKAAMASRGRWATAAKRPRYGLHEPSPRPNGTRGRQDGKRPAPIAP